MNLPQLFRKRGGASVPVAGGRRAASRIHPADAAYMNDLRESQLAQSIPGTRAVL